VTKSSLDPNEPYLQQLVRHKAWKLVGKAGLNKSDIDDLVQDIWLDLAQRLPGYDPSRSQLRTFVTRLVEHKLSNILRDRRARRRDCRRCQSLNVPVGDSQDHDGGDALASNVHEGRTGCMCHPEEEKADLTDDLAQLLRQMPVEQRDLCLRLQSEPLAAIAREVGVPRTTLQESVSKIRRRFEDAGLRDYL
jgi:RNA polymerase sigma factor (sigma-70 family)